MKKSHKAIIAGITVFRVIMLLYEIIMLVTLIILVVVVFKKCSYNYESAISDDGKIVFYANEKAKDAFCCEAKWDGGKLEIVIPDEINGCRVIALGGYIGRGYPCPFNIKVSPEALGGNIACSDYYLEKNTIIMLKTMNTKI